MGNKRCVKCGSTKKKLVPLFKDLLICEDCKRNQDEKTL